MTYRLHHDSGVIVIATGERVLRGEPGWDDYREWTKAGSTAEPAVVELEPIEDVRARVRSQISAWRDQQERGRLIFSHAGREWDGGLDVRKRLQPVLNMPGLPDGFYWTDADDADVPMDMAGLVALNDAHEQAIVARGWQIHAQQRWMKAALGGLDRVGLARFFIGWSEDAPIEGEPE